MHSFRLLDLTLSSPIENLALDEALLDDLEENGHDPILRFWESDRYFVVLGRASCLTDDVHVPTCLQDQITVLRRASGGGTILQGPGCLSYAFVLPISLHPDLRDIRLTNRFILQRTARALQKWQPAIAVQGVSDLAVEGLKISGNAQRRKKTALLFHGTILYGMQADLIARYVKHPKRKPDYRGDRHHAAFLSRIDASPHEMKQAIADAWHAHVRLDAWPQARMSCAILNVVERSHPHKLEQFTPE